MRIRSKFGQSRCTTVGRAHVGLSLWKLISTVSAKFGDNMHTGCARCAPAVKVRRKLYNGQ